MISADKKLYNVKGPHNRADSGKSRMDHRVRDDLSSWKDLGEVMVIKARSLLAVPASEFGSASCVGSRTVATA